MFSFLGGYFYKSKINYESQNGGGSFSQPVGSVSAQRLKGTDGRVRAQPSSDQGEKCILIREFPSEPFQYALHFLTFVCLFFFPSRKC